MYSALSPRLLPALAGLMIATSAADAASVPDPVSGDIFLGFRASGGAGADRSYLVNLGTFTQFTTATAGSSFILNIGDTGADLTTTYGADWASNADLSWGIFGTTDSANPTVYASRQRPIPATQSAPWPQLTQTARSGTKSEILSVTSGIGGYRSREATENSPVATYQQNKAEASSYSFQVSGGSTDFGTLSQWSSIEGNFGNGPTATVLDLYRLRSTAPTVTYVGKFTISGSGAITFTAASSTPPANVDTDADGFTDSQEAAAGTDPNNPSDFFKVQVIQHTTGTGSTLQFNTIPGRTYVVEYSETLLAGSWIAVGDPLITTTTGGVVIISDPDATRASRLKGFYRVRVTQ